MMEAYPTCRFSELGWTSAATYLVNRFAWGLFSIDSAITDIDCSPSPRCPEEGLAEFTTPVSGTNKAHVFADMTSKKIA